MEKLRSNLEAHMKALCLDCGSRHTGSPGERKAADYIEGYLRSLGVTVLSEEFPVRGWAYESFHLYNITRDRPVPGVSACFFLTEQEIGANGGFVRRASASGHTVGFMLDPQSDITLTQQYRDANSALSMECSLVSRVVTIKGGSGSLTPDQLSELISLGVRIWDLSPCGTDMSINELLLYKSEGQAPVFVFEAGGQTAEFIVRFLEDTSYVFSPVYDWTRPVNYVGIY